MKCPICSNDSKTFMKGIFDCDKTLVKECLECKLHFLDPKMTEKDEEEFYKNYYESQKKRQSINYSLEDIKDRAFNHYLEYKEIYSDLFINANSILEIGSGSGGFLKFINHISKSKDIYSIERSEVNQEFLKKSFPNIIHLNSIEEIKNKKFDLIVAFGVFEHVRNSYEFLLELKEFLLDNKSKIVFTVPNNNDVLISFFKLEAYKKFMYMKQHYYTFSKESFVKIAQNTDLNIEKINFIQAWGIDNHFSWLNDRKVQDFSKYTKIFSDKLNQEYKNNLVENEMTDLIQVIFTKGQK